MSPLRCVWSYSWLRIRHSTLPTPRSCCEEELAACSHKPTLHYVFTGPTEGRCCPLIPLHPCATLPIRQSEPDWHPVSQPTVKDFPLCGVDSLIRSFNAMKLLPAVLLLVLTHYRAGDLLLILLPAVRSSSPPSDESHLHHLRLPKTATRSLVHSLHQVMPYISTRRPTRHDSSARHLHITPESSRSTRFCSCMFFPIPPSLQATR